MATENGKTAQRAGVAIAETAVKPDEVLTLDEFLIGGQPRALILECPEFKRPDGVVPKVKVRGMKAGEQDQVARWQEQIMNIDDRTVQTHTIAEQARARVLSWCILDPTTDKPLFSPKHVMDLQEKASTFVARSYAVVLNLSQVSQEEIERIVGVFPVTRADN